MREEGSSVEAMLVGSALVIALVVLGHLCLPALEGPVNRFANDVAEWIGVVP